MKKGRSSTVDETSSSVSPVATGIAGLDEILRGGFPSDRIYLVEGYPGTGKTTLAMQFLLEGVRRGEKALYVTLSETEEELRDIAASHGWSLEGVDLFEMEALEERLRPEEQYTVFEPAEVELGEVAERICRRVEQLEPARVVLDSLAEIRLLARDPFRYRRQILSLKHFFSSGRHCTVLLLDDRIARQTDLQLHSISHGVILLEQCEAEFGAPRRRLMIAKVRGLKYCEGYHDFAIQRGGLTVFRRLVASEHRKPTRREKIASGVPELDVLLGGSLDRGTSALLMGPAGSGKSALTAQYAFAAAERGENSAFYLFDESAETFLHRAAGLRMGLQAHVRAGRISVRQVDPAELSPGEFSWLVRKAVEREHARVIVIDSLSGYLNAMPNERFLVLQLHELLTFLSQEGVLTLLVIAQHGIVGGSVEAPVDLSYLSDTVILLRYFEVAGEVRKAISVVKKRRGHHERTIREMQFDSDGIHISQPLRDLRGVFTGVPSYYGATNPRLKSGTDA